MELLLLCRLLSRPDRGVSFSSRDDRCVILKQESD